MTRALTDPPHDVRPREDLAQYTSPVCGLPLFRERGGRLEQAVRVAGAATIAYDGTALDSSDGAGLLFVPELDAPRTFTLTLDGEERELALTPQRKWEVSVIHHSHLDIGYTDHQPLVLAQHLEYLDAALDLATADDGFRWNVEANLPLTRWLATRPPADVRALIECVRERRIEVCALPYTMHTEAYSLDELARTLRPAQALRERHGIEIVTAMQTDVPGATLALCELLAAADVRYLSVAHNYAGRSTPHLNGGQSLRRPFRWRAPSGRELLVWHTDSPHGIAYMEGNLVGLAESYEETLRYLPAYLHALATRPYPYGAGSTGWLTGIAAGTELTRAPHEHELLHLRVQSAFADNAAPSEVPAGIVRAWNSQWAYPRLKMATNRDFFAAAEERLPDIPTYEGDWTDWWADGIGSAAREVALARRAQRRIRTAQTLHAWADALGERDERWPAEVERAYEDLGLFDEHTWGSANPWNDRLEHVDAGALQWGWKAARAYAAAETVDGLLDGARARLAAHVSRPAGALAGVVVFNPAGTARTDAVELLLPESRVPVTAQLAVVETVSGERVSCELAPQPHAHYRPRGQRLRFLAREVPAYGYARYAIVADRDGVPAPTESNSATLESETITGRLDVRAGTVAALNDLVNGDSAFGFNQYVYDRYATASRVNHLSSRLGAPGMWLLAERGVADDGVLIARTSSALEERATIRLRAPGAHGLTVTYRLVHGAGRLEIVNVLDKPATTDKEAVFFAFPFARAGVRYEITGGVQAEDGPTVPGSAHHMRAIRDWVAVGDAVLATFDAPLVQTGSIRLPYAPFPPSTHEEPGTVFSWALNNGWDTNFPQSQGGEIDLGYAVGDASPPLVGILSSPRAQEALPERGRLASLPDGVELIALGAGRDGGLVAQIHSRAGEPVALDGLTFGDLPVRGLADHLERPRDATRILPGELLTVLLG
jgi:Glycosyl hydrolases family 38 N-terminal domain